MLVHNGSETGSGQSCFPLFTSSRSCDSPNAPGEFTLMSTATSGVAPDQNPAPMADPGFADFEPALKRAYEHALAYLGGLPARPVSQRPDAATMHAALDEPLPETGIAPAAALDEWLQRADAGIVASAGPRFFGFVNGGSTPAAVAGDWLASAIDQNAGMWLGSPAAAQTEVTVLRWLKDLFGLPDGWSGALTSGATMANLVGLAAARQWASHQLGFDAARDGLGGQPPIPVVASTEIHASAVKALATLGLGRSSVQRVAARDGVIDLAALDAALARIDGPVIIIANAGEVNTGAFDPLTAMAERGAEHHSGAWLHVDGAFGLFAALAPSHAHLVAGIERADSLAADGHKWLNVPYDCGFAFVRDEAMVRAAFASRADYLTAGDGGEWDPLSHVPEMSRRFRGLAAWCALKAAGRAGYRSIVERGIANAASFAAWIERTPGLELLAPARLNIVCFRYAPAGTTTAEADQMNEQAVAALQADGRAFVTGTRWDDQAAIRAAFDHWGTGEDDVTKLEEAILEVGTRLSGPGTAPITPRPEASPSGTPSRETS